MFQDLKKLGREYLLTGSLVDTVTDKKATKDELMNLKLDRVLSQAKANFREQPPKISKCRKSLVEVLVLLISKGMELKASEMTDIFFAATQLFQVTDWPIRRLIYVLLDTLNPDAQEAFIVTACLIKEVEKGEFSHRAKAIRRFTRVDVGIATQLEGQIKNAILDKDSVVSSSALVYGEFLYHIQPELVRRWGTEVGSALQRNTGMSQAHALRLLFLIKKGDSLALMKQVRQLTSDRAQHSTLSPTAIVCTLQQAEDIIRKAGNNVDQEFEKHVFSFLQDSIHSPNSLVAFQAAKSTINIATSPRHIELMDINVTPAIETLKSFLLHHCPVQRFGAIRALHLISQCMPQTLVKHTDDIQEFHKKQSSHPTLSILSISTLLNAGNEENVDRLLEAIQLQGMNDMPDGFRLDIIRAVRQLANLFPHKYASFLTYLQSHTREERSIQFKELLIQSIIDISSSIPESFERCLDILCEFIEDSEYAVLTSYSIDNITDMICRVDEPETYVRFIFNRLILESANVRATALNSLTKLGRQFPAIRLPIIKLIDIHSFDLDDAIRDVSLNCKQSLMAMDDESTCASEDDLLTLEMVDGDELEDLKRLYLGESGLTQEVSAVPAGVALNSLQSQQTQPDIQEVAETATTNPVELVSILSNICPAHVMIEGVTRKLNSVKLTEAEVEYVVSARTIFVEATGITPGCRLGAVEMHVLNTLENTEVVGLIPKFHSVHGIIPLGNTVIDSLKNSESKIVYALFEINQTDAFKDDDKVELHFYLEFKVNEDGDQYGDSYDVEPLAICQSEIP
eukprot:GHVH01005829.1.p1 GENE.GHVH01005829.1~~GHVH01005829.1.p1  ORF type:complete len:798 (+),score=112.23 GHVH01005829.1:150-2543(+)